MHVELSLKDFLISTQKTKDAFQHQLHINGSLFLLAISVRGDGTEKDFVEIREGTLQS